MLRGWPRVPFTNNWAEQALRLSYMAHVPVDTRLWLERAPTVVSRTRPGLAPVPPSLP